MARWRGRGGDGEHMAPLAPVPARRGNTCSWRAVSVALLCLLAASLIIVGVLHSSSATARSTASSHASNPEYSQRGLTEANDTDAGGGAITDGPIANISEYLHSIGYDADAEDGGNVFTVPWEVGTHPDIIEELPDACVTSDFWWPATRFVYFRSPDTNLDAVAAWFNALPVSRAFGASAWIDSSSCFDDRARGAQSKWNVLSLAWPSCPADESLLLNAIVASRGLLPPPPTPFSKKLPERWEADADGVMTVCRVTISFSAGRDPLLPSNVDSTGYAHVRWWSNTLWCGNNALLTIKSHPRKKPTSKCHGGPRDVEPSTGLAHLFADGCAA